MYIELMANDRSDAHCSGILILGVCCVCVCVCVREREREIPLFSDCFHSYSFGMCVCRIMYSGRPATRNCAKAREGS